MRPMRRCWWLLLVPSLALAQTPRALFDEGTALYAQGEFARAAEKFEASFAARPVPVTKFNIARAWEQAGETLKAIGAWQAWLEMSPQAPERSEASSSLAKLGDKLAKLGVQAVTITALPLNARISVDGVPRGVAPVTVELTPTKHLLRAEIEGREPQERTLEVSLVAPSVQRFELAPQGQSSAPFVAQPMMPAPLPRPDIPRPTDPSFALTLSDDAVQVHVESKNRDVRLYRLNGNPNGECRAPCDVPIARATDTFAIGGDGITGSRTFVLADYRQRGRVDIKVVSTGSSAALVVGGTLLTTLAIASLSIAVAFGITNKGDNALPVGLGVGLGLTSGLAAILVMALNGTQLSFNED
jgi:hypothetical protein